MMPGTTNLPVRSTTVAFGRCRKAGWRHARGCVPVLHHDRDVALRRRAAAVDHGGVGQRRWFAPRRSAERDRRGEHHQDIRPHYFLPMRCFFLSSRYSRTAAASYQRGKSRSTLAGATLILAAARRTASGTRDDLWLIRVPAGVGSGTSDSGTHRTMVAVIHSAECAKSKSCRHGGRKHRPTNSGRTSPWP